MRNIEIDPYELVRLGLIKLSDNEYIADVSGTVAGCNNFWVGIRERPDGLDKMGDGMVAWHKSLKP